MIKKLFKSKLFQLTLLMGLILALTSCESECDVYVEKYDAQGNYTGWECVTYNQN
tara:strand:- start:306 stop:470 length:165 start_codon:yes stop_codon:yes gene_type:complete